MTVVLSEEIAKNEIWKLHGIPRRILSNKELQFASKFMADLTKVLGMKRILSTAYQSQTDSQTE